MTTIDKAKTGQQIRLLMEKRGVTVRDVKNVLSLACVQSVYHWQGAFLIFAYKGTQSQK